MTTIDIIETDVQNVIAKIIKYEKLVWADFVAFENWLAGMAPLADQALQELASLAQIAAPSVRRPRGASIACCSGRPKSTCWTIACGWVCRMP